MYILNDIKSDEVMITEINYFIALGSDNDNDKMTFKKSRKFKNSNLRL